MATQISQAIRAVKTVWDSQTQWNTHILATSDNCAYLYEAKDNELLWGLNNHNGVNSATSLHIF